MRDLALWPPYRHARILVSAAVGGSEELGDDPDRPLDLVPATGRGFKSINVTADRPHDGLADAEMPSKWTKVG